jgi:hypothetical protein
MSVPVRVLLPVIVLLALSGPLKSVLWDDATYYEYARHILEHPSDPYGVMIWINGEIHHGTIPLAPAVMLYCWAGAMALLGTDGTWSNFGLFPFAVLYSVSFYALCRRFAPSVALPFTVAAALSPWALVSFSYMLDFPAVALGLCALAVFIHASDRWQTGLVVLSGLIAGLALQTKYNAAAIPAAMFVYGFIVRRPLHGLMAGVIAAAVFWAWEGVFWLTYGHSHFLRFVGIGDGFLRPRRFRPLLYGLIENAGPVVLLLTVLIPVALRMPRRICIAVGALAIGAFGVAALGFDRALGYVIPRFTPSSLPTLLTMSGLLGIALWALSIAMMIRLWRETASGTSHRRDLLFLMGWLAIEVAIYFAMSPFPAARRLGEIIAVLFLLCAFAARERAQLEVKPYLRAGVAVSAVSGLVMLAIAAVNASNVQQTVRAAATLMRAHSPAGGLWQVFNPDFDYYARSEGFSRLLFNETVLQPGDMLAVEPLSLGKRFALESTSKLERVAVVRAGTNLRVRVSTDFYRDQIPWNGHVDARPVVAVYRVKEPTVIPGYNLQPIDPPR